MHSIQEYNNFCWASKRAIMDLVMFDHYDVSDKVGVTEWIESLSDSEIFTLSESLIGNDNNGKVILENLYNENLKSKSSVNVIQETKWQDQRNSILMEAEERTTPPIDVVKFLKTGSVIAVSLFLAKVWITDPELFHTYMNNLKEFRANAYQTIAHRVNLLVQKNPQAKEKGLLYPSAVPVQAGFKELKDERARLQILKDTPITNFVKAEEKHQQILAAQKRIQDIEQAISGKTKEVKSGIRQTLKSTAKDVGRAFKVPALVIAGTTAASIALYQIYKRFLSTAAKACKGKTGKDKEACMLTHHINACDVVIEKAKKFLEDCPNSKNPDKCAHTTQSTIWNWERKKQQAQQKLAKVLGQKVRPNTSAVPNEIFRARSTI